MTQREAVEQASLAISRRDAETLLLHVAGRDRAWLLAYPQAELASDHLLAFTELVARRAAHVPLQYLTGHQEFFGLDLRVTPDVLIPRPETELLVEAVLNRVRESGFASRGTPRLVDVGTGSGAIALALASQLASQFNSQLNSQIPGAEIWALDISSAALAVARANAVRLRLHGRVQFALSDLLSDVLGAANGNDLLGDTDAIVSNPPYVPAGDAPEMQPEVRDHEPHLALFAGGDGLEVYRRLIPQAWEALRPGGLLAMEFGFGQKPALARLLAAWDQVRFLDDYAGIPRVVLGLRP